MKSTVKFKYAIIGMGLLSMFLLNVGFTMGYSNNGFDTNHVWCPNGQTGALEEWTEAGVFIKAFTPLNTYWYTVTFAGTGTNDARLFVAKHEPHWTQGAVKDIRIAELDSAGNVIAGQDVTLGDLLGVTDVYDELVVGQLRYSHYRNSLFLSAADTSSGTNPAVAWEIDLDLTTVLNTFTGPIYSGGKTVGIALNTDDGTLYMTATDLNSSSVPNKGDLIAFDTSGGSTSTYTTLIDCEAAGWDPGDGYRAPWGVVYRGMSNTSGHPTIMTTHKNDDYLAYGVKEYYLDQTDSTGNLLLRADYWPNKSRPIGQMDMLQQDGVPNHESAWFAARITANGYLEIAYDDVASAYGDAGGTAFWDIASPGYGAPPANLPPVIEEITPDTIIAPADTPYVQNLILMQGTPTINWTLLEGPDDAQLVGNDSGATVSGWTPGRLADEGKTFSFEVQASNAFGSDTESWNVRVPALNNGFETEHVYYCRGTGEGTDGQIRHSNEFDGLDKYLMTPLEGWRSLTFSGTGKNDARLFAARMNGVNDIQIVEIDSTSTDVIPVYNQTASLSTIVGTTFSDQLDLGNIRYNRYHDTLIIAVNTDYSTWTPATAYEIDLNLSTLIHTYQGPNVPAKQVDIAFDETRGTLLMVNRNLGEDPVATGMGDLIAFNTVGRTVGGTTTTYTTLIDGPTYAAGNPKWSEPNTLIYRAGDPSRDDGSDTVLVAFRKGTAAAEVLEFYLDTTLHPTDGNGNLQLRRNHAAVKDGWGGQQDELTGDVWFGCKQRDGWWAIYTDDTMTRFGNWKFTDIDSPPYVPVCNRPFMDTDADGDVDQDDFGIFQICYTGSGIPIPDDPAYCMCFDSEGDNDIDQDDFTAFQNCATGPNIPLDLNNPPPGCNP